ncbi:MAG: MoaD/ThiS family protein [Anaerolineae bacterium]
MRLKVQLFPPLNQTAGRSQVTVELNDSGTIQRVIDALVAEFGPQFRRHLYDDQDRIVPAWSVFVNGQPVQLNRSQNLSIPVQDGDELMFLLNIAGG